MLKIKDKVKNTIEKYHLVDKGDILVLGLSGGPDSIALLNILCELKEEMDFSLCALHVNHMIRGEEANGDEEYARKCCEALCVPFKAIKIDVPKLYEDSDDSLEEAARKARQMALFDFAKEKDAKIVLAHNQNDQAETMLMRMIRGTGIHGLSAMEYKRSDGIIRPLLDCNRLEIEEYLKDKKICARIDSTNLDAVYTRNKVRLELIPKLLEINPNALECIARLSNSAREDDDFLNQIAKSSISSVEISVSKTEISLDAKMLQRFNPSIFSRVIKMEYEKIGLVEDIALVHLDSLKKTLEQNVGNKVVEFPHGYKACLNHGILKLTK